MDLNKITLLTFYSKLQEGYGTLYERLVFDKLLKNFSKKKQLKSICEFPANGIMGVPGLNTFSLQKDFSVTLVNPSSLLIDDMKSLSQHYHGKTQTQFIVDNFKKSFLKNDSFDFVFNFCVYEHCSEEEGKALLSEMFRISSKYIFIGVQNYYNIATPIHLFLNWIKKEKWSHGNIKRYKLKNIIHDLDELGIKYSIVEKNVFDCPPWPDININITGSIEDKDNNLSYYELCKEAYKLRPLVKTKKISELLSIAWKTLSDKSVKKTLLLKLSLFWLKYIEFKLPKWLKFGWAHHPYIIFEKK